VRITENPGSLGQDVAEGAEVRLDGEVITIPDSLTYIIYNKPVGLVVSRRHQGEASTIYDKLPPEFERLRPVGRLDRDSSGLLVLTDDGDYAHEQTHPSFEKTKRYEIKLNTPLSHDDANHLRQGVSLDDGPSRLGLETTGGSFVVVTISEGRNRQIRRSFEALDYSVIALHRTDFGSLSLGALKPGAWRHFNSAEIPNHA
jgi:pseudouridine synthase